MSLFEFVFSLIGLLLGLSLAGVLSGLVRAIKTRETRRIGLLAPLLGVGVICNAISFWGKAWEVRDLLNPREVWSTMVVVVILTSLFYVAASFVFPEADDEVRDLDLHYWRYKRLVLLLSAACDLAVCGVEVLIGRPYGPVLIATNGAAIALDVALAFLPGTRTNLAVLAVMLVGYVLAFVY